MYGTQTFIRTFVKCEEFLLNLLCITYNEGIFEKFKNAIKFQVCVILSKRNCKTMKDLDSIMYNWLPFYAILELDLFGPILK